MTQGLNEILIFEVAGQRYGLPASMVRELLRAVLIHPVPRSPKLLEGVIDLRGQIVPVLDLRQWLGLTAKPVEPGDHFLVVWAGERLAALRVDRALELACLDEGAIDEFPAQLPETGTGAHVAKFSSGLVLLPDLAALLGQGVPATQAEVLPQAPVAVPPEGQPS